MGPSETQENREAMRVISESLMSPRLPSGLDLLLGNLAVQRGERDGEEADYSKVCDVRYGDTVKIEWLGEELGDTEDYGYVFGLPDIEVEDANMGGIIHIPYPSNPGGKDRADPEWTTLYGLAANPLVKKVSLVESWERGKG